MPARSRAKAAPQPSLALPILAGGVAAAVAACVFRYPGLAVLWVALIAAAFAEPAAVLTGRKDSSGYPTPANSAEQRKLERYRFWRDLRFRLVLPNSEWGPGWPILVSWLVAACTAGAVAVLPTKLGVFHAVNALAALVVVSQAAAAMRRRAGSDCPGTRLDTGRVFVASRAGKVSLAVGALLAVAADVALMVTVPASVVPTAQRAVALLPLTGLFVLGVAVAPWKSLALANWRALTNSRAEWMPRWESLKIDPAPSLIEHELLGPLRLDTFVAPGHLGAAAFWPMAAKLTPMLGSGMRLAVLETPDEGPTGPVPGTRHPLRFTIVTVATHELPDLTDATLDEKVVQTYAHCCFVWALEALGYGRPVPQGVELITGGSSPTSDAPVPTQPATPEPAPAPADEIDPETGLRRSVGTGGPRLRRGTKAAPTANPTPAPPAAWRSWWSWPGGPDLATVRRSVGSGPVSAAFGCEVLFDHRRDITYFGVLDFSPETGGPERFIEGEDATKALADLGEEDRWDAIWAATLKRDANPPTVKLNTVDTRPLADGTDITRLAFAVRLGDDPLAYQRLETKLASSMNGVAFASITGWPVASNRPGERHPQAFAVTYSRKTVPRTPDALPDSTAGAWVLAGHVNAAFDACKLPRPEVVSATCLTGAPAKRTRPDRLAPPPTRSPTGNLWSIQLRLYGGVTLGTVRTAAERLRSEMGAPWLRVERAEDGCTLYVGQVPALANLSDPQTQKPKLISLDWEQAWLDTKVIGTGGLVPRLISTDVMPNNNDVQVLIFELPAGLDITMVREVTKKLSTATYNAYIEIRAVKDTPSQIMVLACEHNPMPQMVPYDFDRPAATGEIVFATGIDGEPVIWKPRDAPHLLFAGTSGPQPLTTRIPVPVSDRFPSGWATMGELAVGDEVYTATGSTTTVTELHPVRDLVLHTVHLSDGQRIECGPDHLWKVSSASTRAAHGSRSTAIRAAADARQAARAASLREAAESLPLGTMATLGGIIKTYGHQEIRRLVPKSLAVAGHVSGRPSRIYRTEDIVATLAAMHGETLRIAGVALSKPLVTERLLAAGPWLTIAEIADGTLGRASTRAERLSIKWWSKKADYKQGAALKRVDLYPVDEVLRICADHVDSGPGRAPLRPLETVVSTTETMRSLVAPNYGSNWAIRVPQAPVGLDFDLAVPPYVLGVWLGDGRSDSGSITQGETAACTDKNGLTDRTFLAIELVREGIDASPSENQGAVINTRGLTTRLRLAGVLGRKHIPAIYLRAYAEQRLAVLQGLMDTDGSIDESGSCELTLTDKTLINDALELVRSLGIKASMSEGPAEITEPDPDRPGLTRRRAVGTRWRIHFTTTEKVFRLPRKAARIKSEVRKTQEWLYVEDVTTSGGTVPMRCISVADTEHLYLTDHFVPTHNSGKSAGAANILYGALYSGSELVIIDPTKGASDFAFMEPYARKIVGLDADKDLTFHLIDAAATMRAIYVQEGGRRRKLNTQYGVGSYLDLPDDVRPKSMIVFIDEFVGLIGLDKVARTPIDDEEMEYERQVQLVTNMAKMQVGQMASKVAAEARAWGIHLILGTQKLPAAMLDQIPNGSTLKVNLARVLLGKTTPGDRMSALRVPEEYPDMGDAIGKGRGVWEPLDDSMKMIQTWFATQPQYTAALEGRAKRLSPEQRMDNTQFRLKLPERMAGPEMLEPYDPSGSTADEPGEDTVISDTEVSFSLDDLESMLADDSAAADEPAPLDAAEPPVPGEPADDDVLDVDPNASLFAEPDEENDDQAADQLDQTNADSEAPAAPASGPDWSWLDDARSGTPDAAPEPVAPTVPITAEPESATTEPEPRRDDPFATPVAATASTREIVDPFSEDSTVRPASRPDVTADPFAD